MGKKYRILPLRITDKAELMDATAEELRLLLALIECEGYIECEETLAEAAKITAGRCRASLRFWREAGVISEVAGDGGIIDEHPARVTRGELAEESGVKVAADIRKNNLKPLFDELSAIFERNITTGEAKIISGVVEQYGVSAEYLITLAAYLKKTRGFTVAKLRDRAISLFSEKEIDTLEALEVYISVQEKKVKYEYEIRGVFGIYDRAFSDTERKYFKTWSEELGYGADIISVAYDEAVMKTDKRSLYYINKILTEWNKAGLKSPDECREYSEKTRPERQDAEASAPKRRRSGEPKPRYGNFDIDEAFQNALFRSYGEEEAKK